MADVDTKRFAQICGMLGSEFDGERANAAKLASKMLRDAGLTWASLLEPLLDRDAPAGTGQTKVKTKAHGEWTAYELVRACCERSSDCVSDWDEDFVQNLNRIANRMGRNMLLSEKQWSQLKRIAVSIGVPARREA